MLWRSIRRSDGCQVYLVHAICSVRTILKSSVFFLVLVRIKNMFLFDEGRAEQQFHYRTVMTNWLFTPNLVYQDLASKFMELWSRYLDYESVPGFGSKDPSESWGTWCVTCRREGIRLGAISMLCITNMYAKTPLPLVIQEGSDQGRHGLPNEPGSCWQTSTASRWNTASVEALLRRPGKNASAVSYLGTQNGFHFFIFVCVLMVCCRALLQVQSMQGR